MNGGDRLTISPAGNALLMDVDCGSGHERKNWDGPQPTIEKLDPSADEAVRISGKDDDVWEPFWLTAKEFLCIIQKENENRASIYRMSLDGKNPKLIVKHARTPTASAPQNYVKRSCHVERSETSLDICLAKLIPKISLNSSLRSE